MSLKSKIGLALAGGGPEGAVYEIGALQALQEGLDGIDFTKMDTYVGVSAGSFLAACLANNTAPAQLCRAIVKQDPDVHPFTPETFLKPALLEWVQRALRTPRLAFEALGSYLGNPRDLTLLESFTRLSHALPVGLFDNEPVRAYLEKILSLPGRTDDFRELERDLFIVAADLDSGQAVRFGEPGFDHVPISKAVQASTALPGLYPPVLIDGRHYVDGVLLKTLHCSVALDADCDLVICVNPIVPVDTSLEDGAGDRIQLVGRGLPTVLSQTFRTLVHSRLTVGISSYEPRYPDADVVLFEPERDDHLMFFTNIFSFSQRKAVCEHAYQSTRKQLLARRQELEPILARHGIRMRIDKLRDPGRDVWTQVGFPDARPTSGLAQELGSALDRLQSILEHADGPEDCTDDDRSTVATGT